VEKESPGIVKIRTRRQLSEKPLCREGMKLQSRIGALKERLRGRWKKSFPGDGGTERGVGDQGGSEFLKSLRGRGLNDYFS